MDSRLTKSTNSLQTNVYNPLKYTTSEFIPESEKFNHEKYTPPCWVDMSLQKRMKKIPKDYEEVSNIGIELWEASGGTDSGLEEFIKFGIRKKDLTLTHIRYMWNAYFPPDSKCSNLLQKIQKVKNKDIRVENIVCQDCEKIFKHVVIKNKRRKFCEFCVQENERMINLTSSVVEMCLC